jgi:hypothetical protein
MSTNQNHLDLSTSLKYGPDWNAWQVRRELDSNCHDTGMPYSVTLVGTDLIFQDQGDGMSIRHVVLFGEHEQNATNSGSSIGQFGEGLKLSMVVWTRMGKDLDIYSNNRHYWNSVGTIDGVDVLRVNWEDCVTESGTKIVLHNWEGETFNNNFLHDKEDERVISINQAGWLVAEKKLFSKGVYVCDLPTNAFGYNSSTLTMNRDRSAVNENQIRGAVGSIWTNMDSTGGWLQLFKIAKNDYVEEMFMQIWASDFTPEVINSFKTAFHMCYGNKAVIKTNDSCEREAKHRGANVINIERFGPYMQNVLKTLIKTDYRFIEEQGGLLPKPVKPLTPEAKKNLAVLKKMAKKVGCDFSVVVATIPTTAIGLCDFGNQAIWIKERIMNESTPMTSGSVMIHELAHWRSHTDDMTEAHDTAVCEIGMLLSGLA